MEKLQRILVTDDDRVIQNTIALILRTAGYDAEGFDRPEHLFRAAAQPFDLLISDVLMPEMTGFEVAARAREIQPACKVLLISAMTAPESVKGQDTAAESFPVVGRPLSPSELIRHVHDLLG